MDDIIEIAEGVAESLGEGAEVSFAPEFDLKSLKTKKLVVVPVGIESKPDARDYLEDRLPEGERPSREAVARGRAARKGTRGSGRE